MMETTNVFIKLIAMMSYALLAIWWWVTWVGMHNNVEDGNTFKLIYPFAVFDKSLFNERGNQWRVQHLYSDLVAIIFSVAFWGYQAL